ncbi:glutamine synthetase beta-grasp domain-containing protein [Luminiphilus sp.]|nr:glutamine synthetase beta-grasp domain-containing protein [Luminiphilus sp.]MDA9711091.1 glutamine synthetase beta-grasp domain-containing protein [Luminiphilus sp.]
MSERTLNLIHSHYIRWMDLRLTDMKGKEQHVSIPGGAVDKDFFADEKMFDGSSISGWKRINESAMIPIPDDGTTILDPFMDDPALNERCDIVEPSKMQCYDRDPRSIAKKNGGLSGLNGRG